MKIGILIPVWRFSYCPLIVKTPEVRLHLFRRYKNLPYGQNHLSKFTLYLKSGGFYLNKNAKL